MIKPERLDLVHLAGRLSPLFSMGIFRLFSLETESSCQRLSFQQATEGFEMASKHFPADIAGNRHDGLPTRLTTCQLNRALESQSQSVNFCLINRVRSLSIKGKAALSLMIEFSGHEQ
jgi:hypothetical protein